MFHHPINDNALHRRVVHIINVIHFTAKMLIRYSDETTNRPFDTHAEEKRKKERKRRRDREEKRRTKQIAKITRHETKENQYHYNIDI